MDLMMATAEEHTVLGCAPSVNAYGLKGEPIADGRAIPMRWCGWHVHIGGVQGEMKHPEVANHAAKACDLFAGIAAIALFGDKERKERRRYYGMPGEYRLPDHGFEYRPISGMMGYHPVWTQFLLDVTRWAYRMGVSRLYEAHGKFSEKDVIAAIINSDVDAARGIIKENEKVWQSFMKARYKTGQYSYAPTKYRGDEMMEVLLGKAKIRDAGSVEKNWKLNKGEFPCPCKNALIEEYDGPDWITHAESANCSVGRMVLE